MAKWMQYLQDELNGMENEILHIAIKLGEGKKPIELKRLYKASVSQLNYTEKIIVQSINTLFQKKYIVEGHELTKANLLDDEKRNKIYDYIKKHPGAHIREIQSTFGLGTYDTLRNLKYLEIFGFIRSKRFLNKLAYFIMGTDETQDVTILVLRNDRTKLIFDQINLQKKVRLSDLEKSLNLKHGQIQHHVKKLLEHDLIDSMVEEDVVYYYTMNEEKK